jgi:hypothetical protein
MSGTQAAMQSTGCCCRPLPTTECTQGNIGSVVNANPDRYEEVQVSCSISAVFTVTEVATSSFGTPCECSGGQNLYLASMGGGFVSRVGSTLGWIERTVRNVGSVTRTLSDCYADYQCCYLYSWPPCVPYPCFHPPFVQYRKAIGLAYPNCGFDDSTIEICQGCGDPREFLVRNYRPINGIVVGRVSLGITTSAGIFPCPPDRQTSLVWAIRAEMSAVGVCNGEEVPGANLGGGFSALWVKPCCNSPSGPEGTYRLVFGNRNESNLNGCLAMSIMVQCSETASVSLL